MFSNRINKARNHFEKRIIMNVKNLKRELIRVGFYYQGIGYYVDDGADKIIEEFNRVYNNFIEDVEKNGVEFYYEQLKQIMEYSKKGEIDYKTTIFWMMDIFFLTKAGYLKEDNDNGMIYFYTIQ